MQNIHSKHFDHTAAYAAADRLQMYTFDILGQVLYKNRIFPDFRKMAEFGSAGKAGDFQREAAVAENAQRHAAAYEDGG